MPQAQNGDTQLYYEVHGEGVPLLMIRGFASNADHWYAQVPAFSQKYTVIVFDNRGVGRSDRPDYPYSMAMMAGDALAVLDALNIRKAYVLGISMGGMIAQVLALNHPDRIKGLILGCTHCGGDKAVPAPEEVIKILADYALTGSPEAAAEVGKALFTKTTLKERPAIVRQYQEISDRFPAAPQMLMHQFAAVQGHDAWADLPRIQAPTLAVTGDQDMLIPPENARILADRIPGARLEIIPDGAHQVMVEQAETFNRVVLDFLESLPEHA